MAIAVNPPAKLDALTSLRFFAALMIVFHHAESMLQLRHTGVNWGQGVSFFFVLSGFILAYVYPRLASPAEATRFLRARFARIWPAHAAAFVIGFLLVPYAWDGATALANLSLVHAWIPMSAYYFSYNGVSWSVSTEAFFYVVFPLLILGWRRTWAWKLAGAAAVTATMLWLVQRLGLPEYGGPTGASGHVATAHGLVYIHPATRLFEFVLGMAVSTLWQRWRRPLPFAVATLLEVGALLACAFNMTHGTDLLQAWPGGDAPMAARLWVAHSGSLFAFALLIGVMANGGGAISRALSRPAWVLAGEISFSMYLLHYMLMFEVARALPLLTHVPGALVATGYGIVLLATSYLLWVCIEVPGRRWLVGGQRVHASPALASAWRRHAPLSLGAATAAALLLATVAAFHYAQHTHPGLEPSDQATADRITPPRYRDQAGAEFGGRVALAGLDAGCTQDEVRLQFVWRRLQPIPGPLTAAVHFIDAQGTILAQADHPFPPGVPRLDDGDYWAESLARPRTILPAGVTAVAIGVYDDAGTLFTTDRPGTDWDGRRLIFPLAGCGPGDVTAGP